MSELSVLIVPETLVHIQVRFQLRLMSEGFEDILFAFCQCSLGVVRIHVEENECRWRVLMEAWMCGEAREKEQNALNQNRV